MEVFLVFLIKFIDVFSTIFNLLIFARVLMSWLSMGSPVQLGRIGAIILDVTEPVFKLFRRFPLRVGMVDLTPLVVIMAVNFVSGFLISLLSSISFT